MIAQAWSPRFASAWMHACNCGETLTTSAQENAANRTAATRTRAQVCERPELFIGLGACDNGGRCASNFLGSARASGALPRGDAFKSPAVVFSNELLGSLAGSLDLRLEDDLTFARSESFRRCACADHFRVLSVLVVSVLIRRDQVPTEMSQMTPAL